MSRQEKERVADIMLEFISNTITGHESGFYKLMNGSEDTLKSDQMRTAIDLSSVNYLNQAYKSLIKNDDEYFAKYFKAMAGIMNHSYICLLNIILVHMLNIHEAIKRSDLDTSTYDNYMTTIEVQIKNLSNSTRPLIVESISHDCHGEDIKDCDPEQDLFVIGMHPQ